MNQPASVSPELQQMIESLGKSKEKIKQGLAELKSLHHVGKGQASPKTGEVILGIEGLFAAIELQQGLANAFNDYVFTTALQNGHRMNSLIRVLREKDILTDEELKAATEALVEEAKAAAKAHQESQFDEAVAPDDEAPAEDDEAPSNISPILRP